MKDLIFETLVAEAQFRVVEMTTKGHSLDEAIDTVTSDMELSLPEVKELKLRSKKAPSGQPKIVEDESDDGETDESNDVAPNQIKFASPEELETAVGVLMYKGIPWSNRTSDTLTFMSSQDVSEAHDALKRRWDFVNLEDRTVATIAFDNIADYQKVLDFIASKSMAIMMDDSELDSDVDMEIAEAESRHKKAKRDAKEAGLEAPENPTQDLSYRALHKDNLINAKELDPVSDSASRSIRVVKRWK